MIRKSILGKDIDDSVESKPPVNINVREIERIVFSKGDKNSFKPYVEEDSYINPPQKSCE